MSRRSSKVPIFALSPNEDTRRRVTLFRGVYPVEFGDGLSDPIVDIDELLRARAPEVRLAAIQPGVGRYPTHAELALAEARACAELGRRAAAIASASRAARYARSPALRRWIEGWIADLEAATGASR